MDEEALENDTLEDDTEEDDSSGDDTEENYSSGDDTEEENPEEEYAKIWASTESDTDLEYDEYFKESVDSAKAIGSISLDLSNLRVSLDEFRYLADQLKDSNIENIMLKDSVSYDDELTAISAGLKHSNIKKLTFGSNEFGRDGLLALTSALKQSKIEYLELSDNRKVDSDAIHILINSLPLSNITTLNLWYTKINFQGWNQLADTLVNTKITVLGLKGCGLNDNSIKYLSTKLNNSKIQSLNLAKNGMSSDSLKSVADVLENTAITELNIYGNKIGPAGAQYLAGKLSKSVVQNLDIGRNEIKSEGCLAIGNVIHLTQIIKLNLERNLIDSSGIASLAVNLKESNVKHLNLNENNLGINGAQVLANGMKDSKLEYLNVDSNQLSNVGMGMILDALQFTKITEFYLSCRSNEMKVENMKLVTNAFKFLKLKKFKLALPKNENIVQVFFNELKTLIESNHLDEILSIKNKMNFLINIDLEFSTYGSECILNAIKHFHMKKITFPDCYYDDDDETWIPSIIKMLKDTRNPISNLTTFSLDGIYLRKKDAIILAKNLKYLKLTRLNLIYTDIDNDGVIAIADELKNTHIRYLNLLFSSFNSDAASYLINAVKHHPVKIKMIPENKSNLSAEEQIVLKNMDYMYLKAQLLVRSVSDNSPVKYDKDMIQHLKAYEIFKNVDLLWESERGKYKYDFNRIDSEIRSKVTKNFLKIIGVVNSDTIYSNILPTEILIMICSYLKINDIKFNELSINII